MHTSLVILKRCVVCLFWELCKYIHSYHREITSLQWPISLPRQKALMVQVETVCILVMSQKEESLLKSDKEPQKPQGSLSSLYLIWPPSKIFHTGMPKSSSGPVGFQEPCSTHYRIWWFHYICTVKCKFHYSELLMCHVTKAANPGPLRWRFQLSLKCKGLALRLASLLSIQTPACTSKINAKLKLLERWAMYIFLYTALSA